MRTVPQPLTLLAAATLIGAGALAAQAPAPTTPPVPTARSLWFDAGALTRDYIRFGVEAVPLGRFTFGLSIAYSRTPHPQAQAYPYPYGYVVGGVLPQCDPRMLSLCIAPTIPYYGDGQASRYRAWVFDLAARYYPAELSFRNGGARMTVYAGAYVGYHWRTWDEQPLYYQCGVYPCPMEPGTADSVIGLPLYPSLPYVSPLRHILKGVQPGLEAGVRLLPSGPFFLELGGRFTLVVVDDPMQRPAPGDVDARLVLTGGVAW
jgi:hypothetical protein